MEEDDEVSSLFVKCELHSSRLPRSKPSQFRSFHPQKLAEQQQPHQSQNAECRLLNAKVPQFRMSKYENAECQMGFYCICCPSIHPKLNARSPFVCVARVCLRRPKLLVRMTAKRTCRSPLLSLRPPKSCFAKQPPRGGCWWHLLSRQRTHWSRSWKTCDFLAWRTDTQHTNEETNKLTTCCCFGFGFAFAFGFGFVIGYSYWCSRCLVVKWCFVIALVACYLGTAFWNL